MAVVRISEGKFDAEHAAQAERLLVESERVLREALSKLPGLLHYYAAIDKAKGEMANVSVWDTMEHAHQVDTLKEMLAQRPILEAGGVSFRPITNHEVLWTIGQA